MHNCNRKVYPCPPACVSLCVCAPDIRQVHAALHNSTMKQPRRPRVRAHPPLRVARRRRDDQRRDELRSGAVAHERYVPLVAAEAVHVLLQPGQRCDLIRDRVVAAAGDGRAAVLGREGRVREEAEDAEPVVDRDKDDGLRAREVHCLHGGEEGAVWSPVRMTYE